jgi:hypothetical protein
MTMEGQKAGAGLLGSWLAGYGAALALMAWPLFSGHWPAIPMAPSIPGWLPGDGDPWFFLYY